MIAWYVDAYHGRDRVIHGLFDHCSAAIEYAVPIIRSIEHDSKLYDCIFIGTLERDLRHVQFAVGKWNLQ